MSLAFRETHVPLCKLTHFGLCNRVMYITGYMLPDILSLLPQVFSSCIVVTAKWGDFSPEQNKKLSLNLGHLQNGRIIVMLHRFRGAAVA